MADENATRFEQLERATQELKDMFVKSQEEHREQMASLMDIVLRISKGKENTEATTGSKTVQKELCNPSSSIPIRLQTSQDTYPMPNTIPPFVFTSQRIGPLPSPPVGAYTYPYMPPMP